MLLCECRGADQVPMPPASGGERENHGLQDRTRSASGAERAPGWLRSELGPGPFPKKGRGGWSASLGWRFSRARGLRTSLALVSREKPSGANELAPGRRAQGHRWGEAYLLPRGSSTERPGSTTASTERADKVRRTTGRARRFSGRSFDDDARRRPLRGHGCRPGGMWPGLPDSGGPGQRTPSTQKGHFRDGRARGFRPFPVQAPCRQAGRGPGPVSVERIGRTR